MIRYKLKELIARWEFQHGRRLQVMDLAKATGVHRMTLSKILNHRGCNTVTDNLDRLCRFFDCRVEDLIEYVPDELVEGLGKK